MGLWRLAVLDEVEGIEDRGLRNPPSTTASPSMVKLVDLIRSAATAIAGSLAVKAKALRL
jgi:hypothetical protein